MENSRSRQSPDLFSRIEAVLGAHCAPGARLLVGYSGGLDSTVLVHALAALRERHGWAVECVHVHHGLSPHADRWAQACAATCDELGLPFTACRVDVAQDSPDGLECAAREARYTALHAHARTHGIDLLLTAHHADDQAETLLHHMVRGAGLLGMAGMPAWRAADAHRVALLRPLLGVSRATIEDCARELGLCWVEDESNQDTRFARNYLRRQVMPVLSARWPRAAETIAGLARRLGEAQGLLDTLAQADAGTLCQGTTWGDCYRIEPLAALEPARQRNVLRWLLRRHGARTLPNEAWLDEWLRQICSAQAAAECPVAHAGVAGFCHRGALWLMPDMPPPAETAWDGARTVVWGAGQMVFEPALGRGIALSAVGSTRFSLRARAPGDRLPRGPARPRASVKQIAQESGLPPWLRDRAPILLAGGVPVWMPGCELSAHFAAPGEPGLIPVWRPAVQ
jgi:tRNA(Ile)-lysidine synthase